MTQLNDISCSYLPKDSISSLVMNGTPELYPNLLLAGSWDASVTCYSFGLSNGNVESVNYESQLFHQGPVLCVEFATDGVTAITGGVDKEVKLWNTSLPSKTSRTLGRHDDAISNIRIIPQLGLIATSSWDRQIKFWDIRQPTPAVVLTLVDSVFAMDTKGDYLVAGTSERLAVYDIREGHNFARIREYDSPLKYQTRVISIFSDLQGYAIGCIEGRTAIEYFNPNTNNRNTSNFMFRCHRERNPTTKGENISSVNAIAFAPQNTFLTAGSDGVIAYWDKNSRYRLKLLDAYQRTSSITAAILSPRADFTVYSLSYDWSMGKDHGRDVTNLLIHRNEPNDFAPRRT